MTYNHVSPLLVNGTKPQSENEIFKVVVEHELQTVDSPRESEEKEPPESEPESDLSEADQESEFEPIAEPGDSVTPRSELDEEIACHGTLSECCNCKHDSQD